MPACDNRWFFSVPTLSTPPSSMAPIIAKGARFSALIRIQRSSD
jgi:hypothetical protein